MNGSPQAGAQMLTLLGWGALKHVWNMECFAHSPPRQVPHENNTIVVTKDCAATPQRTTYHSITKALVAHLCAIQTYRRLCSMFADA